MSYGFCNFCSFGEDKSSTLTLINKDSEIPVGKDRIYKLSHNEELNDYTQSFCHSESNEINPPNKLLEKYNLNNSIFEMKMPYICIFCGGESCKWEDPSIRKNSAIHGLLADLYYDCVYECQRPSTCLIKKYHLLEVFKKKRIKLIVNCQINGEHPYCGPNKGLEEDCGFSYSPSAFISEGIEVLCKGFKDLTPPDTLDFMLDVVRKMAYVVKYKKGRILVHCHAGNGRTGIVIVCFFMFYFNKTYQEALTELRKLRKKGVEKIPQEIYCQKFGEYIKVIKNFFPSKRQKIHVFLKNQKILDYDFDKSFINSIVISYYLKDFNISNIKELSNKIVDINFIPKLIFECIEKIIEIKIFTNMSLKELYLILNGMNVLKENSLQAIKIIREELKVNNWDTFKIQNDIAIINELLFIWMNECVFNCIDPQKIEQIINDFILLIMPSQNNSTLPESKISNDKLNTIDNELLNKIQKLFEICIDNPKNQNMEILNKMINITKLSLSKLEYETIKYISIFLQIIYPTNKFNIDWTDLNNNINNNIDDSNIYEFKRFLYRFSLFLLGYNLDKINSTPNKFLKSKELLHAKMLIFIFELFIFHKNDSLFNLNEFTRNNEVLLENEDLFFKYKNSNELRSIKNFL
jgi:hypothetical protein